jgi:hypothetical protein
MSIWTPSAITETGTEVVTCALAAGKRQITADLLWNEAGTSVVLNEHWMKEASGRASRVNATSVPPEVGPDAGLIICTAEAVNVNRKPLVENCW